MASDDTGNKTASNRMKQRLLRIAATLVVVVVALGLCPAFGDEEDSRELAWPVDIGTSHFGVLGPGWRVDFAGAWIRPHPGPFIWGDIESTPGVYRWTVVDRVVQDLQRERLAILATVWPFARWDQETCHSDQARAKGAFREFGNLLYSPCDVEAYTAWLTTLVERYDGDGVEDMPRLQYPIRHWEILNEPEMQGAKLCFFQEEPDIYVGLLRLSFAAIKAADPTAVVLPAGQSGMHQEAVGYWRSVLQGARGSFDLANIHSINCSDIQQASAFWAPEYRIFLNELGYSDAPYWITEALAGWIGPPDKSRLTEDELVQLVFIGSVAAFAYGAEVIFHVGANDPKSGKQEPAQKTFNLMGDVIGDFIAAEFVAQGAVRFDMPDGRTVYALWDGALLPDEVTGTVDVIPCSGEVFGQEARAVVGHVPLFVVVSL